MDWSISSTVFGFLGSLLPIVQHMSLYFLFDVVSTKKVGVLWLDQTETILRNATILAPLYVLPTIHIEGIFSRLFTYSNMYRGWAH